MTAKKKRTLTISAVIANDDSEGIVQPEVVRNEGGSQDATPNSSLVSPYRTFQRITYRFGANYCA